MLYAMPQIIKTEVKRKILVLLDKTTIIIFMYFFLIITDFLLNDIKTQNKMILRLIIEVISIIYVLKCIS